MYRNRKLTLALIAAFITVLLAAPVFAQMDTLRFCTWNVLNYPERTGASPLERYRTVLEAIQPDIFCAQEVMNDAGQNAILNNVLNVINPGEWATSPNTDANLGTNYWKDDSHLYYKTDKITLLATYLIGTDVRYMKLCKLEIDNGDGSDILYVITGHLKASNTTEDKAERGEEAQAVVNRINTQEFDRAEIIFCGDFNLYTASEPAWDVLVTNGPFVDPINRAGSWNNNESYEDIHTQSTRLSSIGDGGSTGGLDDRFDFILMTAALNDGFTIEALTNTYWAFGNDGNHFNSDINTGTNSSVSDQVADALYYASDHLPVIMDLVQPVTENSVAERGEALPQGFRILNTYPNPFNATTTVSMQLSRRSQVHAMLFDVLGRQVKQVELGAVEPGIQHFSLNADELSSGIYLLRISTNFGEIASNRLVLVR